MRVFLAVLFIFVIVSTVLFHSERFPLYNAVVYQKIAWNSKALEMREKACKHHSEGCVQLGLMYEDANHLRRAQKCYLKACTHGESTGCDHFERLSGGKISRVYRSGL